MSTLPPHRSTVHRLPSLLNDRLLLPSGSTRGQSWELTGRLFKGGDARRMPLLARPFKVGRETQTRTPARRCKGGSERLKQRPDPLSKAGNATPTQRPDHRSRVGDANLKPPLDPQRKAGGVRLNLGLLFKAGSARRRPGPLFKAGSAKQNRRLGRLFRDGNAPTRALGASGEDSTFSAPRTSQTNVSNKTITFGSPRARSQCHSFGVVSKHCSFPAPLSCFPCSALEAIARFLLSSHL